MGRDKALVVVDDNPLVATAVFALRQTGADPVLAIGGDHEALARLVPGAVFVPDLHAGEGPLGGLVTALDAAMGITADPSTLVVVIACDMPRIDGPTLSALVSALDADPAAGVAVAVVNGRWQPLTAAWRPPISRTVLARAFAAGERAPRRVLPSLRVVEVSGLDSDAIADVDRPEDLDRYAGPQ